MGNISGVGNINPIISVSYKDNNNNTITIYTGFFPVIPNPSGQYYNTPQVTYPFFLINIPSGSFFIRPKIDFLR